MFWQSRVPLRLAEGEMKKRERIEEHETWGKIFGRRCCEVYVQLKSGDDEDKKSCTSYGVFLNSSQTNRSTG